MVFLKTKEEIAKMKKAGIVLSRIIEILCSRIKAGIKLSEIDMWAEVLINNAGARPAFKNYRGYPSNICTSVNEVIVHGIPDERKLENGDILSLDIGMEIDGFFVDTATTFGIGKINPKLQHLIDITREALYLGINQAKKDNHLFDISNVIQGHAEKNGFSVVRDFVGHGIGRELHEDPEIPNYGQAGCGPILQEGMVLAIEPMINLGKPEVEILDDGWTAVTKDRLPSAHFEHTIAVTSDGPKILTS
ncbi:MAG: type I methionyl aminopeptidase [Candidatus Omnitrophota bacterium]